MTGLKLGSDEHLLAVLERVEGSVCLRAHSSYYYSDLAPVLKLDPDEVLWAQGRADDEGLVENERKWTGSWRRVRLTAAGRRALEQLRRQRESGLALV